MRLSSMCFSLLLAAALLAAGAGCAGPAPAAQFLQQADRLHDDALASAVSHDDFLNRYVQEVGRRIVRAAQAAVPQKAGNPVFGEIQFHLVTSDTVNAFT